MISLSKIQADKLKREQIQNLCNKNFNHLMLHPHLNELRRERFQELNQTSSGIRSSKTGLLSRDLQVLQASMPLKVGTLLRDKVSIEDKVITRVNPKDMDTQPLRKSLSTPKTRK